VARDAALHNASGQLTRSARAGSARPRHCSYTGRDNRSKHGSASSGRKVIGLKSNGLGGKGISTTWRWCWPSAAAPQAGVKPGEIVVWDRNARDLQACGLTINTDPAAFASTATMWPASRAAGILGVAQIKALQNSTASARWCSIFPSSRDHGGAASPSR